MPELRLLLPSSDISPSPNASELHIEEQVVCPMDVFRARYNLAWTILQNLVSGQLSIEDVNNDVRAIGLKCGFRGSLNAGLICDNRKEDIIGYDVAIEICPSDARNVYDFVANLRKRLGYEAVDGDTIYRHEESHYAMAHGLGAQNVQFGLILSCDSSGGDFDVIPCVLRSGSLTAIENMHIAAAPYGDMGHGDRKSAQYWADMHATQLNAQQVQ